MSEGPFVTSVDFEEHLRANPKSAHGIWALARGHIPSEVYSQAEIDAFFEGESAGKKQVDWARITSKPGTFPPSAHTHDDRYYTETELNDGQLDTRYYTKSQINTYLEAQDALSELDEVFISSPAEGHILQYNASQAEWQNVVNPYSTLAGLTDTNIGTPENGSLLQYWTSDSKWHDVVDLPPAPHQASHESGGSDEVDHDSLAGFLAAEHLSLPNTIANVLTNHNKTVHDSLNISAAYIDGVEITAAYPSEGEVLTYDSEFSDWRAKPPGVPGAHNTTHEDGGSDPLSHDSLEHFLASEHLSLPRTFADVINAGHTATIHNALNIDHGSLSGRTDDDHSIYYNSARHTKAIHDALDIDARYIDGKEVVAATPTDGYILTWNNSLSRWEDKTPGTPGAHASSHESGQSDALHHDDLDGFLSQEHVSLPNSMANVINSGHTKTLHDGLGLDHGSLSGRGDDDHTQYYNSTRHTKAVHDALDIDARYIDGTEVVAATPTDGHVLTYVSANTRWEDKAPAAHSHAHGDLTGVTDDQHHSKIHAVSHKSAGGDAIRIDELKVATDITTLNATTTYHGLLPKLYGGTARFLRADGTWQITPGGTPDAHADSHEVGGSDLVSHDLLTDFVAAEHLSLPNSLANVINSGHDKATHDALNIDADTVDGEEASAIVTDARVKAHFPDTIANVLSNHTKAVHDALDIDARYIDGKEVVAATPTDGYILTWNNSLSRWEDKTPGTPGVHGTTHEDLGGDEVAHDMLEGYLASEHKSLPRTFADVINAGHTAAIHNSLNIDHGSLGGKGDDDHMQYVLASGTRAFTGVVSGITPTVAAHLATKGYVDGQVGGVNEFVELTDTPANYTGSAGKFVKVNATPDALVFASIAWTDVSKTGSNLTDLATRQHAGLTDVTANQHHDESHTLASHSTKPHSALTDVTSDLHHAQVHATEHEVGGGDLVSHDDLTDFLATEHFLQSAITTVGTIGTGIWQGTPIANAYIAGINQDLLTSSIPTFPGLNINVQQIKIRGWNISSAGGSESFLLGKIRSSSGADGAIEGIVEFAYDYGTTTISHTLHFNFVQRAGTQRGHWWYEHTDKYTVGNQVYLEVIDVGDAGTDYEVWVTVEDFAHTYIKATMRHGANWTNSGQLTSGTKSTGTALYDTRNAPTSEFYIGKLYLDSYYLDSSGLVANNKVLDSDKLDGEHGSYYSPTTHDHVKADITDTPWAWTDVSKTGSNLTDLATRQHAGLTDVTSDQHHAETHVLAGAKHTASGLTIGWVIKATGTTTFAWGQLPHDKLGGLGDDDHSQYHNDTRGDTRYYTKTQINTYLEAQDELSEMDDVNIASPANNQVLVYNLSQAEWQNAALPSHSHAHGDLTGVTDDQHHNKIHAASHKSAGGDAIRIDELKVATDITTLNATTTYHGLLPKLYGGTARFLRADGTWQITPGGTPDAHADSHEVGGSDLVSHDLLTDFVAAEHLSLPNSLANVINSGHDKATHDALNIDADTVDGEEASAIVTDARVKAHFPDTIANILSDHTKTTHDALDIDARYIDGKEVVAATPTDGYVLTWNNSLSRWEDKTPGTPGAHGSTHEDLGGDEVAHDMLEGYLASEHKSLPRTFADVINAGHTAAIHNSLNIDHGSLGGKGDDDHTQYILASGTRAFTGVVSGITPTVAAHLATKGYVDTQVGGVNEFVELTDTPANYTGSGGKFVKVNATPDALVFASISWADVSKTGSNLTDLATRQHAGLTDVTSDQHHAESHTLASHSTKPHSALSDAPADAHHPQSHTLASHSTKPHSALTDVTSDQHHAQSHASEHEVGGGDLVSHDDLTDFLATEHFLQSAITTVGTIGTGTWQATPIANAYIAGINQNLLTTSSPAFDGISARRFSQVANGVPTSNLGTPTVTEMALFETQFNNKTEFYNINNLKFYTYDGTWTEYTAFSDTNKRRFLGGDTSSGIYIPNLTEKFRIEITNSGAYVYLNALYMYWSSSGSNTTVHIWRRYYATQVWSRLTSSTATVSSWPGHMYLPFPTIAFHPSSTTRYDAIRIEFTPNWSGENNISLYRLQLWGGYPAGKRRTYSIDEYKKVTFPNEFAIGTINAGVSDYDKFLVSDGGLVKYRTGAEVLSDIGASGSGHSHAHSTITSVTSDQHHAQLHASEHEVGGGDLISHDDLTDFVAAEHVNLPANIAAVLSNHNLTIHNALGITQLGTVDTGIWQGTDVAWAYVSKTGSNLTHLATRQHAGLTDVTANQHHPQSHTLASHSTKAHSELSDAPANAHHPQTHTLASHTSKDHHLLAGLGDDDHSQYYNSTRHTKAVHDALGIDAHSIDGVNVVAATPSNNEVLTYVSAETRWEAVAPGAPGTHAASHEVGGGDLVYHDDLTGYESNEHLNLPNSMTNVINSGHTKAIHNALDITELGTVSSGIWQGTAIASGYLGDHATAHHVGGGDLVNHDSLTGFVGNEHISHGNVSMIAGSGLSGGGTIVANRTFNLGLLTAAWDAGPYQIRALKFYSDQATGTAPFTVVSTTKVVNLNAERVDDLHAASFIRSDADDNVSAHTEWQDNKEARFGAGADYRIWHSGSHSYHRSYLHGANVYFQAEDVGGTNQTCLTIDPDILGIIIPKFQIGSYYFNSLIAHNKVPDSDKVDGYHASMAAGNNTVVVRNASGYIYCNYLNCTSSATTSEPTHYFVETGNDSFLRQMTPANFVAKLAGDGLMPKSGGTFSGPLEADDHTAIGTDKIVNVCFGTGSPPTANTTTRGALFVKYTA